MPAQVLSHRTARRGRWLMLFVAALLLAGLIDAVQAAAYVSSPSSYYPMCTAEFNLVKGAGTPNEQCYHFTSLFNDQINSYDDHISTDYSSSYGGGWKLAWVGNYSCINSPNKTLYADRMPAGWSTRVWSEAIYAPSCGGHRLYDDPNYGIWMVDCGMNRLGHELGCGNLDIYFNAYPYPESNADYAPYPPGGNVDSEAWHYEG